ncbi:hypothetical protein, conserved [Eimeria tenella]|uniref:Uncharacterized protein n=1 Tax=Eimeria tenella TaxID=5802 RepID=U6KT03_EIMTE|nr:hypothetical protein, conserved [Eimeria tenella]CDJ41096.1 hypothetical protein, conserved [Eimeria tenella]|eukprot:XP_013231846.1 hypothetical protein, conserved [Eimeria tenella]
MLSKKPFQSSRKSVAVSQVALSSSQDDTTQELTDAEVARLMRQHLNILSTNQGASEAEVVKAAKTLQQRFLPPLAGSLQLPKTGDQGKETLQPGGLEGNKGASKMHANCEGDSAARLSAKDMTLGPSDAACIWLRGSRLDCLGAVVGSPASNVEHGMTGLQLSQSRDPHAVEVGETTANFQQASVDVTTILQCDMNHTSAREDGEQPRKKVCLELRGLST